MIMMMMMIIMMMMMIIMMMMMIITIMMMIMMIMMMIQGSGATVSAQHWAAAVRQIRTGTLTGRKSTLNIHRRIFLFFWGGGTKIVLAVLLFEHSLLYYLAVQKEIRPVSIIDRVGK